MELLSFNKLNYHKSVHMCHLQAIHNNPPLQWSVDSTKENIRQICELIIQTSFVKLINRFIEKISLKIFHKLINDDIILVFELFL